MTDKAKRIVEGLRRLEALLGWPDEPNPHIHRDAADLIERLSAEVDKLTRERDTAATIIRDARTYLTYLGSTKYALMQLIKWPCAEDGGQP